MVVRRWCRLERASFARRLAFPSGDQPGLLEHPPNARGADSHHIRVQHHEGQSSIAFQGMFLVEADDGLLFPRREPEIPGDPTVVFIDAPVALSPVVELAGTHTHPTNKSPAPDLGLSRPTPPEIPPYLPHT